MLQFAINPRFASSVYSSVAISVAGALSCFSKNEWIKIPGMTITIATVYGILNDMIACRDCIEYFTVGHFWDGRNVSNRLVMNLDPNINAIFWGIYATTTVSTIAGVFLSFLARLRTPAKVDRNSSHLDNRVTAKQIFPFLSIFSVINFVYAHFESRKIQQILSNSSTKSLSAVAAGWQACSVRNKIGYQGLAIGTLLISTGIVATRIFCLVSNWYHSNKKNN